MASRWGFVEVVLLLESLTSWRRELICLLLLPPACAVTNAFSKRVLGSLDIGDAYLKVPQAQPRQVHVIGGYSLEESYVM